VLPGVAAIELVLARNARAAVYIGRCSVYPVGFELEVCVLVRAGVDELNPSLSGFYVRAGGALQLRGDVRFGVAYFQANPPGQLSFQAQ
jgi:hypothetical protein